MRFEAMAALLVGTLLPIAEVLRRKTDFSDPPAYIDDFLIGAILIFAAVRSQRRHATGNVLLVTAWALFCGGMYYSFFGQLGSTDSNDISGLPNSLVVAVKGMLWTLGAWALFRSVRFAIDEVGRCVDR